MLNLRPCVWVLTTWLIPSLLSANTITVNSTSAAIANDGLCTFTEAIHSANLNVASGSLPGECAAGTAGLDTIVFAIPGPGLYTIMPPPNGVPASIQIIEPLFIDGFSQAGSVPNTNPAGQGLNTVFTIELDLTNAGPLDALNTTNVTIRGLLLNRSNQVAIVLEGGSGKVEGCYIGTNAAGTAAGPGNATGGIVIGSANNTIGGLTPDKRNLISGNAGAAIATGFGAGFGSNVIQGNLIGTNAAGTAALPNSGGVAIGDSRQSNNLIGGASAAARNVISGNSQSGIGLGGLNPTSRTPGTIVQGNYVGTDLTGTVAIPNSDGVSIIDGNSGNLIGGTNPGEGNLISGNTNNGVNLASDGNLFQGNLVGTNAVGTGSIPGHASGGVRVGGNNNTIGATAAGAGNHIAYNSNFGVVFSGGSAYVGNRISSNSIHGNNGGGIALGNPPAPDDHCDGDGGNNNGQNKPVLTQASISGGNVTLSGTLDSTAGTNFRIEFFSNAACKTGLFDKEQGKTYLGFTNVTTDGSCNASFGPLPFPIPPGETVITATATNIVTNDTSEFSTCFHASTPASFYTVTPCRLIDTRGPTGPYGAPSLAAGNNRSFVATGEGVPCGVPASATAISINITAVLPTTGPGHLTFYPSGAPQPLAATINYNAGKIRANNAIVPLGGGTFIVYCGQGSGTVDLVVDIDGYFQ